MSEIRIRKARAHSIREALNELCIEIPKECDKASYLKGLHDGVNRERKRIKKLLKEAGLL